MSPPQVERPDVPEFMTWEKLERLSEDIGGEIELWDGRAGFVGAGTGMVLVYPGERALDDQDPLSGSTTGPSTPSIVQPGNGIHLKLVRVSPTYSRIRV